MIFKIYILITSFLFIVGSIFTLISYSTDIVHHTSLIQHLALGWTCGGAIGLAISDTLRYILDVR